MLLVELLELFNKRSSIRIPKLVSHNVKIKSSGSICMHYLGKQTIIQQVKLTSLRDIKLLRASLSNNGNRK